jgi:hypothetical protein
MEKLIRLLVEELERRSRSSEYDRQLRQTLLLLRRTLSQFSQNSTRIQRSNFESCCDDNKLANLDDCATEDCSQVGLVLRKIVDDQKVGVCQIWCSGPSTPCQIVTFLHSPHTLRRSRDSINGTRDRFFSSTTTLINRPLCAAIRYARFSKFK